MVEKFRNLGISENVLKSIAEREFHIPSEIQEKAIPLIMAGKDVIGSAATGSGKTLAFGAGILHKAKKGEGVQALVLTPTRELAVQVSEAIAHFGKHHLVNVAAIYGGVNINPQMRTISRAEVIVGTPGRILDHLARRTLNLSGVKILVLDEADRMADMGFLPDVKRIIEHCPEDRQTLLFSATLSADIENISRRYMRHPEMVIVEQYVDASKLEQSYYDVDQSVKFSLLVYLLKKETLSKNIMIFCNTRRNADIVAKNLYKQGFSAMAIHGGLNQNRRATILQDFHSGRCQILVCTDVAARGLDIPTVSHVYNYDLPKVPEDYIDRIGRTARAGKEGKAISIVSARDYENMRAIMRNRDIELKREEAPEVPQIVFSVGERRGRFNREGGRGFSGGGRGYSRGGDRGGSRGYSRGSSGGYSRGGSYGRREGGYSRGGGRSGGGFSRGGDRGGRREEGRSNSERSHSSGNTFYSRFGRR